MCAGQDLLVGEPVALCAEDECSLSMIELAQVRQHLITGLLQREPRRFELPDACTHGTTPRGVGQGLLQPLHLSASQNPCGTGRQGNCIGALRNLGILGVHQPKIRQAHGLHGPGRCTHIARVAGIGQHKPNPG